MDGVAELVANDGLFAADEEKPPKPRRSVVKRGAILGATLMFIGALMIADMTRFDGRGKAFASMLFFWAALITLIGTFGYLKRLVAKIFSLIAKIFSEEEPSPSKRIASPRVPALPSAYSAPVTDSGQQFVDTSKMGHPSSVTEQTTSRLNKV